MVNSEIKTKPYKLLKYETKVFMSFKCLCILT